MKVESSTIHGFTVEEGIVEDTREYTLPSGLALLVGTQPKKIQADLAIASNDTTVDHDEFFAALKEARSIGLEVVIATDLEFNGPHAKSAEKALATKLKLHKHIIRPGFSKFFYGTFEDTNFVQLISQCSTPKKFPRFVQHCLKIAQTRAKHSTSKGEAPNYHTHIPNLIATLQEYTNVRLTRSGLPDIISGR
ncbi:MAG: hypothetical protein Q7K43_06715, partial [Candidatus Woesearchaeota archaeon]|nr:hypothetical protein [Candidatus Woesearchaeota archaeon]